MRRLAVLAALFAALAVTLSTAREDKDVPVDAQSVNAVGGGFIPTDLEGGGAGEFGAAAEPHQTGGRGR